MSDEKAATHLDAEKIGQALLRIAMISRTLGHSDMACTVRDYLAPHVLSGFSAAPEEELFVMCALTGGQPLDEEDAVTMLQAVELSALATSA